MKEVWEALSGQLRVESLLWIRSQVISATHHGGLREGETVQEAEWRAIVDATRRECAYDESERGAHIRTHNDAVHEKIRQDYKESLESLLEDIARLNAVNGLLDCRKKTLKMDDLRKALGEET